MYLEQVDSTHCSPLPKEKFHLPPYWIEDDVCIVTYFIRRKSIRATKEKRKYSLMNIIHRISFISLRKLRILIPPQFVLFCRRQNESFWKCIRGHKISSNRGTGWRPFRKSSSGVSKIFRGWRIKFVTAFTNVLLAKYSTMLLSNKANLSTLRIKNLGLVSI